MLIEEDWKKIPFGIRRHFQESIRDYKKTYGYPLPLTSLENIKKVEQLEDRGTSRSMVGSSRRLQVVWRGTVPPNCCASQQCF